MDAIVWDFDGTLVDSMERNWKVTYQVLKKMNLEIPETIKTLAGYKKLNYQYKNWKELYRYGYNMSEDEVQEAGMLWTPLQAAEKRALTFYPGILEVILQFKDLHQGICSQNSKENIIRTLTSEGVYNIVNAVIGYEEVKYAKQKPEPDALFLCLDSFFDDWNGKSIVYIGDHEEDAILVDNARKYLAEKKSDTTLYSILISHDQLASCEHYANPDYRVNSSEELKEVLMQLRRR